jgi:MYXO-CTERM domain-containing protein
MTRSVTRRRLRHALAGLACLGLALGVPPSAGAFFGYFGAFVPGSFGSPAIGNHALPPFPHVPPPPPQNPLPKTFISPVPPPSTGPTETPEPTTLLTGALGAGVAGVIAWRRRRRKARGTGQAQEAATRG